MNLFQTNFLTKMSNLLREAFKFKKYKAMHPALAVLTGIAMLPMVIVSFALVAVLSVLGFLFTLLSTPAKYLHQITRTEGKVVMHATQAVVYLISWPVVFALYAVMIPLLLSIFVTYALFSIVTYAWTLCGFKFHLFPNEADDISITVTKRYFILPLVLIIGCFIIKMVAIFTGVGLFTHLWELRLEQYFPMAYFRMGGPYSVCTGIQLAFSFLYSIIGFHNRAKKVEKTEE